MIRSIWVSIWRLLREGADFVGPPSALCVGQLLNKKKLLSRSLHSGHLTFYLLVAERGLCLELHRFIPPQDHPVLYTKEVRHRVLPCLGYIPIFRPHSILISMLPWLEMQVHDRNVVFGRDLWNHQAQLPLPCRNPLTSFNDHLPSSFQEPIWFQPITGAQV